MGTFLGHALPGSFFVVFATWWTIQITRRHLLAKEKGTQFCNSATYPCPFGRCATWPTEGVIKLAATTIGMVGELIASTDFFHAGRIVYIGDIQHVTMYGFFWLAGLTDLLTHFQFRCVPPGTDYMMGALAFAVEGILFMHHLVGRSQLDVLAHTLLLYVIGACVISSLVEYSNRGSVLAGYARAYFTLLQGTWFWQAGFILHPPLPGMTHWDSSDHRQMMLVTMVFTWHCAGVAVVMMLLSMLVMCIQKRYLQMHQRGQAIELHTQEHLLDSDSEEEIVIRE